MRDAWRPLPASGIGGGLAGRLAGMFELGSVAGSIARFPGAFSRLWPKARRRPAALSPCPAAFLRVHKVLAGTELFDGRRLVRADPRRVGRRRAVVEPSRVEGRLRCAARVRRLWRRRCQARAGQGGLCGPGPSSAVPPSGACGGASTARAAGAALGVPVDLFGTRCPALSPALEPCRRARTACQEA